MSPKVRFSSDNFRVVEVPYPLTKDRKENMLSHSLLIYLEERKVNSMGESYFAPILENHYGNLDLMANIISIYQNFIRELK